MKHLLKFRGISLDTEKMVFGYGVVYTDANAFIVNKQGLNMTQMNAINPETVAQFTGMTDWDGNEIYHGDYLQNHFDNNDIDTVVWNEDYQYTTATNMLNSEQEWKAYHVIGNIYENLKNNKQ